MLAGCALAGELNARREFVIVVCMQATFIVIVVEINSELAM